MELFTTEHGKTQNGAGALNLTAALTNVASDISATVLEKMLEDVEKYGSLFEESKTDSNALDTLIETFNDLTKVNIDFLKQEDEDVLERALKSQQSKRSRSKSKAMTQENYKAMMTAAVSELLIRIAMGKPKGTNVGSPGGKSTLSDEDINKLRGDTAAINKAIRNVQSRKSIAKSKLDFDEQGERYQEMLALEAQLKRLRDEANGIADVAATEAMEKQEQIKDLIMNVNSKDLKLGDARALIEQVQSLVGSHEEYSATTEEESTTEVKSEETEEAIS